MPLRNSHHGTIGPEHHVQFQRSEKMQEIVSDNPGFLVRKGNLFFLIIGILIALAFWFIQYPDFIRATARLTSINAPKPVISLISGKLIEIKVRENQIVEKEQILGAIESTADHEEVLNLSEDLDSIQKLLDVNKEANVEKFFRKKYTSLGEIQSDYQTYLQSFLTYRNYLPNSFYLKKKELLQVDMRKLKEMHSNLKQEKLLQEQGLALTQATFEANQSLKNEKAISDFDYRSAQGNLITKKLSLPQINSAIISNETLQNEKKKEIMELDNMIYQQKIIFQQAVNTFRSQVDEWKKKYFLITPIKGRVAFASFIQENQQLQNNQTICFVNPENTEYFAEIIVPQSNFGKCKEGQEVLLKFQSYPYHEFGAVKGKIDFISNIATEGGYLARVKLSNGLITNFNKPIQYREGLTANAEIITRKLRLVERVFYPVASAFEF